jgi:hypothetical protein
MLNFRRQGEWGGGGGWRQNQSSTIDMCGALKQVLVVYNTHHYLRYVLMTCFYRGNKVDAAFTTYIVGSLILNTHDRPPHTYTELRNFKHMTFLYS